ncbi:flagellar hook protein FlgE [Rhodosalinus sediminis]|uniref:flagellar hook protein FlgE n=1 Tax=Rhodosalinus sediminis TaxID=1940533 RepID=UPI0023527278|nr:flagellar hook protein FlgE [Rhodosalinus sediminis]
MSMNIALSGLNAARSAISNTSNNIANAETAGYRGARAHFGDLFSSSPFSPVKTQTGNGVELQQIRRSFEQGALENTGNILDMAIEGRGFFTLRDQNGGQIYSRAGAFGMDRDGTIVNNEGLELLTRPVAANGAPLGGGAAQLSPLSIPMTSGTPQATGAADLQVSLPANGPLSTQPFDAADPATYAESTPIEVRGADGTVRDATVYFARTQVPGGGTPDTIYTAHLVVDGTTMTTAAPAELTFDADGQMTAPGGAISFTDGGDTIDVDFAGSRLDTGGFAVDRYAHDGRGLDALQGLEIDEQGVIWASYGDQAAQAMGQVALAGFNNEQGLRPLGSASFAATQASGDAMIGGPQTEGLGSLRASALEGSNVDLTEEMVNLISSQRNYQASAKALETSSSLTQTIMNIRS